MVAAISILDLLRRNPNFGIQTFSLKALFSSQLLGAAAVAAPFTLFGNSVPRVAYCDAEAALDEDYVSRVRYPNIFPNNDLQYTTKRYDIQLKPLLSAFHWKHFGLISLRSFLLFYLPLLDPNATPTDDDEKPVDFFDPFKKSVKHIIRETSITTTKLGLQRFSVHYATPQMAWKLLKDVPMSATRKAAREIPTVTYLFRVSRTTFRGRFLGVLASWLVQVGLDIYRFFSAISTPPGKESDAVDPAKQVAILGKRICGATLNCGASLIFASIGAGIGATLRRSSTEKWIGCSTLAGCIVGDVAGPMIVEFCLDKLQRDLGL